MGGGSPGTAGMCSCNYNCRAIFLLFYFLGYYDSPVYKLTDYSRRNEGKKGMFI